MNIDHVYGAHVRRLATLLAATLLIAACTSSHASKQSVPETSSSANGKPALYSYTCCDSVIEASYSPGATIKIRWASDSSGPAKGAPTPVKLDVSLTGPYPSAAAAKSSSAPQVAAAKTITITDQTGGSPTSAMQLPANIVPGIYNMTTDMHDVEGEISSSQIVQVRNH